jgi:hypothetical protein
MEPTPSLPKHPKPFKSLLSRLKMAKAITPLNWLKEHLKSQINARRENVFILPGVNFYRRVLR